MQPEIAKFTRVCAYDRAGYGWSDASPKPRTSRLIVKELHTLLNNTGIQGPYVLAGHSLGGYFMREYDSQYPDEVVGMVLVDTSHEDEWSRPEYREGTAQFASLSDLCRRLAPLGLWRLAGETGLFSYPVLAYAPPSLQKVVKPTIYRSSYCSMVYSETNLKTLDESRAQVRADRRPLGDMPLVVLTAGAGYQSDQLKNYWLGWQNDLANLSTNSRHIIVEEANHFSILISQAPVVVDAIHQVVDAVRTKKPLELK